MNKLKPLLPTFLESSASSLTKSFNATINSLSSQGAHTEVLTTYAYMLNNHVPSDACVGGPVTPKREPSTYLVIIRHLPDDCVPSLLSMPRTLDGWPAGQVHACLLCFMGKPTRDCSPLPSRCRLPVSKVCTPFCVQHG